MWFSASAKGGKVRNLSGENGDFEEAKPLGDKMLVCKNKSQKFCTLQTTENEEQMTRVNVQTNSTPADVKHSATNEKKILIFKCKNCAEIVQLCKHGRILRQIRLPNDVSDWALYDNTLIGLKVEKKSVKICSWDLTNRVRKGVLHGEKKGDFFCKGEYCLEELNAYPNCLAIAVMTAKSRFKVRTIQFTA